MTKKECIKQFVYKIILPLKKRINAYQFLRYYRNSSDPEILEMIPRIKKTRKLEMFNYDWVDKYDDIPINIIHYDENHRLFYVMHCGRKMYLRRGLDTKKKCLKYYRSLFYDQDESSPHRYLTDSFNLSNDDVILDAGVAEGNFTLEHLNEVKRIICVECDPEWIECIKLTFKEELANGKIVLIEKMLGKNNSDKMTTIDAIFEKYTDLSFIKMDIEGFEQDAIIGGGGYIHSACSQKWLVCTYHKEKAFAEVSALFPKQFNLEHTNGYMILNSITGKPYDFFRPPYVRRGLIRASKTRRQSDDNSLQQNLQNLQVQ